MVHVVQKMKGRPSFAPIALIILVALIGQYQYIILYQRLHDINRENVSLKDQHAKLQSRLSNVNNPANIAMSTSNSSTLKLLNHNNNDGANNNITYGHIHVAKTGGTVLNGMLALNYERVCGHKGYSHDYYQHNKRYNESSTTTNFKGIKDSITKIIPGYGFHRGRVPFVVMIESGFEDCDWISFEKEAVMWGKLFNPWHTPLELHLPCRDPLDHLMSQCNHDRKQFNCNTTNLGKEIDNCIMNGDRFNYKLVNGQILPNGNVKCYDYQVQFTKYINYMNDILQMKKLQSVYVQTETNTARNKSAECVWGSGLTELRENIIAYLMQKYDYYSFCDSCIGSKRDLFAE